jgi:hypothetical protein
MDSILAESIWYWIALLTILVTRIAWCGNYLVLSTMNPSNPELHGWAAVRAALKQTTTAVTLRKKKVPADQRAQRHVRTLEGARRQEETVLILGSLALAAWTQLYAAAGTDSLAAGLSDTTRALLFTGVIMLIAGSVLFRAEGLHFTLMGRELVRAVGYSAVVFSLASAIPQVFGAPAWVGVALAFLIAARDWAEVAKLIAADWVLWAKPRQQQTSPPPTTDAQPEEGSGALQDTTRRPG